MSDINGGQFPQVTGSPIWPGTVFTGPLIAGNVIHSDGTGNLAGVGESSGIANQGYVEMTQAQTITQAASTGQSAGVFVTSIVIPAQSLIVGMKLRVTTAFTGTATTLGIGSSVLATAFTTAAAIATAGALGDITLSGGTGATQLANWSNVGNTDVQIVMTSTNTGNGVAVLIVTYVQGINL